MADHEVTVGPLPRWVPVARVTGVAGWSSAASKRHHWVASLPREAAADVAARLRGLGFGGHAVAVACAPALPRTAVRAGRTRDARARRDTTAGFERRGVRFDEEGRWSATPEALAVELGECVATLAAEVVDAGCGVGANSIGFARAGMRVHALELDPSRAEMARHNVGLYGVEARVRVITGDVRTLAPPLASPRRVLFIDPPWGADWDRVSTRAEALPLVAWAWEQRGRWSAVVAKLPPSFDPASVGSEGAVCEAWFGRRPGDRHRVKFVTLSTLPLLGGGVPEGS